MGSKAILYRIKRFGKRLTSPQQWSLKDLIPHGMLSIMITILKSCTKYCYFFILIFPLLSQSKNDQKCIVYRSHADILLQHYIISRLCVLFGKNGLRDECGVEFNYKGQLLEPDLWLLRHTDEPQRGRNGSHSVMGTIPLCFGFFRCGVDVLQS